MFPKYVRVNTRDIDLAIREAMRPMTQFFDPRHDGIPFFSNEMTGNDWGNGHHASFSMAHIPGRWLNALLSAEDVLGLCVCEDVVETLAKWAYRAITLPGIRLPGCIDPKTMEVVKQTDLHNLREQMHALYALYRYRGNEKAKVMALEMIDTLDAFFDDTTGQLDEDAFRHATGGQILKWTGMNPDYPFPLTFGRYIGPLVKFYRATGESRALAQALRLKQFCFQHVLNQRGDYSAWRFGNHTHSTTAMISSLAQLMDVTRDIEILQRIQAFMDRGLKEIALDFGWCIENYNRSDNVGEINNTADILETCLILGKWGIPGMYARAERILRGHLLPSQLLDTCFIPEDEDESHTTRYHMPSRAKGAFGFPCPYGHEDHPGANISFNWDIVGGAVGGLCEAKRAQFTLDGTLFSVNLLFDGQHPLASFKSPYGRDGMASLTLMRQGVSPRVRIPSGVSDWHVTGAYAKQEGEWLYLMDMPLNVPCHISFQMTPQQKLYPFRDRCYQVIWLGEEITGFSSPGKRLCYFPNPNQPKG